MSLFYSWKANSTTTQITSKCLEVVFIRKHQKIYHIIIIFIQIYGNSTSLENINTYSRKTTII